MDYMRISGTDPRQWSLAKQIEFNLSRNNSR